MGAYATVLSAYAPVFSHHNPYKPIIFYTVGPLFSAIALKIKTVG